MKVLTGIEAFDWTKKNNLMLFADEDHIVRLLSSQLDPQMDPDDREEAKEKILERIQEEGSLLLPEHGRKAKSMIGNYGADALKIYLESDDPAADERTVLRALLRIISVPAACGSYIGTTAGVIEEKLGMGWHVEEIFKRSTGASCDAFPGLIMPETAIYHTCLRLVEKKVLATRPAGELQRADSTAVERANGNYWFAVVQPITETLRETAADMTAELAQSYLKRLEDTLDFD